MLKGPQGDLYGRNTTGGQINFISNAPTDSYEAGIIAGYGRYKTLVVGSRVRCMHDRTHMATETEVQEYWILHLHLREHMCTLSVSATLVPHWALHLLRLGEGRPL